MNGRSSKPIVEKYLIDGEAGRASISQRQTKKGNAIPFKLKTRSVADCGPSEKRDSYFA